MRTDADTVVMPHALLAALFGRRPEPALRMVLQWFEPNEQQCEIVLRLRNDGRGTAKRPVVVFDHQTSSRYGGKEYLPSQRRYPSLAGGRLVLVPSGVGVLYPGVVYECYLSTIPVPSADRSARTVRLCGQILAEDPAPVGFDEEVGFRDGTEAVIPSVGEDRGLR